MSFNDFEIFLQLQTLIFLFTYQITNIDLMYVCDVTRSLTNLETRSHQWSFFNNWQAMKVKNHWILQWVKLEVWIVLTNLYVHIDSKDTLYIPSLALFLAHIF